MEKFDFQERIIIIIINSTKKFEARLTFYRNILRETLLSASHSTRVIHFTHSTQFAQNPYITQYYTSETMKKKILAIDIGGSKMLAALVNVTNENSRGNENETGRLNFEIQKSQGESLPAEMSEAGILRAVEELTVPLFAEVPLETIDAVGVTIPGLADERVWIYAPFSGIQNFRIVDALEERFQKPIYIENDVNACAIAEGMFGACREVQDFIWLTISNGIGGGVVLDGKIYRGACGFSGEFGHICVVEDGELCGCGKRGCLEAECAGPGISRYYARISPTHEHLTAAEISQRAAAGEKLALETFRREGRVLGLALANAANILNPSKIILGGGVARSWDLFYPSLEASFRKNVFQRANAGVQISPTALGYEAALVGAVSLAVPHLF